jgi:thiopurine S-methyltransferase
VTGRNNQHWLKMWRNDQTDFHQQLFNPLLARFWPSFNTKKSGCIFVPLCGKSLDLIWFAQQGYNVVGVELSPVATKSFFEENNLTPHKSKSGEFIVWKSGRIKILCGDFFSLTLSDLGEIDVIYDRAALTALPEDMRASYVAHLRSIVPLTCSIFLLTTEDASAMENTTMLATAEGVIDKEITTLYERHFIIDIAHTEPAWETDSAQPQQPAIAVEHKVYQLSPRT